MMGVDELNRVGITPPGLKDSGQVKNQAAARPGGARSVREKEETKKAEAAEVKSASAPAVDPLTADKVLSALNAMRLQVEENPRQALAAQAGPAGAAGLRHVLGI